MKKKPEWTFQFDKSNSHSGLPSSHLVLTCQKFDILWSKISFGSEVKTAALLKTKVKPQIKLLQSMGVTVDGGTTDNEASMTNFREQFDIDPDFASVCMSVSNQSLNKRFLFDSVSHFTDVDFISSI